MSTYSFQPTILCLNFIRMYTRSRRQFGDFRGRDMRFLAGETALVTGAGKGIGRALALALGGAGARVTLVSRTAADVEEAAGIIRESGGEALAVTGDVGNLQSVSQVLRSADAAFGPITILVNNAGVPGPYGPLDVTDPSEWWASLTVNLYGPALFMHSLIPTMRARRRGRIINIVSNGGLVPIPHLSAYAVSKNALIRLTEIVHMETRSDALHAFALNPGNIRTDMARGTLASPEAQRWVPEGIKIIGSNTPQQSDADLRRCCEVVLALARGQYDRHAGRYLDIHDDLDGPITS
jgi:NAD(P)-dependent dehydrogenase (short-subunit alcohol dehydrogenase family)